MTGNVVGTPYFMPRQQVVNYKYAQPDVDVWAAAACLYGMITGYSPRNLQDQDPFLAVLQTDAVPVDDRTYAIPQPLATVIDRALIDNPEIYYKSAAEFKQVLLNSRS
ncbi:hypothetical protein Q5692_19580 [Microcoleus sp. C2C3]|uniref:hypothetical protein n=1 Tax=unclassified Microcoleus TaxID=2642155 RepID=UPI002FD4A0E4